MEGDGGGNVPSRGDLPERDDLVTFESGHVRPMALSSDGSHLYVANTPDNRMEIFDVSANSPQSYGRIFDFLGEAAFTLNDADTRLAEELVASTVDG